MSLITGVRFQVSLQRQSTIWRDFGDQRFERLSGDRKYSSPAVSGACPHSDHPEEASRQGRGIFSLQVSTSRHLWSFPACFQPFTVINSLALNVCPSPLFALWAVSLMCIPRSAVTRSGAMELHCHSWYLSPELTSWKHQSAPAAAGNGLGGRGYWGREGSRLPPLPSSTGLLSWSGRYLLQ